MILIEGETARHCIQCEELKHFDEFHEKKGNKYGYSAFCIECNNIRQRKYYNQRKEKHQEYAKQYRRENKEKINRKRRKLYNTNEKVRRKRLKRASRYFQENREKTYKYKKNKYNEDKSYKISVNMRNRINAVLKGTRKSTSADKLIGCSWDELKQHLEDQWEEGMSWENHTHDGWHVDHIIPCNAFDLTNPHAQAVCFHYSNLRPMWGSDNISKYDSIPDLRIEIDKEWLQNRGIR